MSTQILELKDDGLPDAREHPKAPDPFSQKRNNNHRPAAIVADTRIEEERIPGMVKEFTVWDVYNNEARKVDNELVKDWTASLNFLLVFAAIFAAVLTAFIIESKKMLEPDHTEILVNITMQYFNSIGNPSRINITQPDFEPTSVAVSINCCLFASLGASLVAALASVVSLQWVADYDAAITRGGSSPEDRAKRRQFRHAGVVGWKMGEIIAGLPLLLYSSVILFWAGAIQWMWSLHHIVGYVVAGGTSIAVLFYTSTTLLGAIYVSSPFRTPLSRGLYWCPRWPLSLLGRFLLWVPLEALYRRFTWVRTHRPSSQSNSSEVVSTWIRTHLISSGTSRQREDETAKQDPALEQEALAWLAEQLPISADSLNRLHLFVRGMLSLPRETSLSPRFLETPWLAILEFLSARYMQMILYPSASSENFEGLDVLLHLIDHPCVHPKVVPGPKYEHNPRVGGYWNQYPGGSNHLEPDIPADLAPMTFLLARDVPIPSLGSQSELEATCKLIRWRNSLRISGFVGNPGQMIYSCSQREIWPEIFSDISPYSPGFFKSCLLHFQTWINLRSQMYRLPDYGVMFNSIAEQALRQPLGSQEVIALAQTFVACVTSNPQQLSAEEINEGSVLIPPLSYAVGIRIFSESTQAAHHAITLLLVRASQSLLEIHPHWIKSIALMLEIGGSKDRWYSENLNERHLRPSVEIRHVWERVEVTLTRVRFDNPHIEEITSLLWPEDEEDMVSLSRGAFKDPAKLMYFELLYQCSISCRSHASHPMPILLHLYRGVEGRYYAGFREGSAPLGFDWTDAFNPIFGMLALSNTQDLSDLRLTSSIQPQCAKRILAICKTMKEEPVEFIRQFLDVVNEARPEKKGALAIILEVTKQVLCLPEDEIGAPLLRQLTLRLQEIRDGMLRASGDAELEAVIEEAQRICCLLHAKSSRFITSTTHLRLLSCVQSDYRKCIALGWLRMHVDM